ncbi:MAG: tetratricopeptide repeat protein [Planctomycetaceae bacterium]|nr:tetratricopeptide repeat protein [Planctomycetales bacterium]MCB9927310.1 tetratricopeptide repeat protein [Planctomycetaceae bacterium]
MSRSSSRILAVIISVLASTGCKMVADGQNIEGVRLQQQGQHQAALQQFQQAITSQPTNADAYYNMAATYHRLGIQQKDAKQLEQAETLYNQCLDLNEDHVECRRGLAVLLTETDRSDRAFNLLKNWANSSPQLADARVELARLYEESGDYETAKLHLNKAILLDQHNARAWAALGNIREQLGDTQQALANYQRSYNLNSFQPGVAQRIASLSGTPAGGGFSSGGDTRIVTRPMPGQNY